MFKDNYLKIFLKSGLSTNHFLLLLLIKENATELMLSNYCKSTNLLDLKDLQPLIDLGYIDTTNNIVKALPKLYLLFGEDKTKIEEQFNKFWDKYHDISRLPKTDLVAAKGYWLKLTPNERELCLNDDILDNYKKYISKAKYPYKCRTYISNKHFNEFIEESNSNNNLNIG